MRYERLDGPGRAGATPTTTSSTAAFRTAAFRTAASAKLREK